MRTVGHVVSGHGLVELSPVRIQLDEGRKMRGVVAVVDPIPGPIGAPRERNRLERIDDLRDADALLVRRVQRVRNAVTLRVQAEIKTVQMHRVIELGEVDHPPVDRVVLRIGEALRVRP